jgi:hypothetical protein
MVRCLSDGLAICVPRIEAPFGVLRIQARLWKTQLALQLYHANRSGVAGDFRLRAPNKTAMTALQRLAVHSYCLRRCALP